MKVFSGMYLKPDDGAEGQTNQAGESKSVAESFDEMLKQGKNQSEFDRRVAKAIETSQAKWQEKANAEKSEAERLARMSAEQKAEHERQKRESELAKREEAVARREMRATASQQLSERSLPQALAECLDYSSAEACGKSIDAMEKAFRDAVQAAVTERMKGRTPESGGGGDPQAAYDAQVRAAMGLSKK